MANTYQDKMTPQERRADNSAFQFEVTERIAVLGRYGNVTKELNKVSYRGRPAKYDIRSWQYSGEDVTLGKGITLTDDELAALKRALDQRV